MIANVGFGILIISLTVSVVAIILAVYGAVAKSAMMVEASRRAALLTFPLLSLALIGLIVLLVTDRFEYAYVYQTSDALMPLYLKIAAVWGGQEGSLLFWCWLLSGFSFATLIKKNKANADLTPWVIAVTSFVTLFFLFLVLFFENPFFRFFVDMQGEVVKSLFQPLYTLQATPDQGLGMNPLLRHFGMVVHPPMLYIGFTGFVIPYAYAIAALIEGRVDSDWIRITRKWTLIAWVFLTIGLVLGSRWAYDVLGWGGYWAWDPVETSALMPWLTGTAFLHSNTGQEKRGLFKHWNISLIILTFCLVILGTFLTRSGMLSSVHAFSESEIAPLFFGFIAIMLIGSAVLLGARWNLLRSDFSTGSFFSRESLYLFNNLIFISIFLICLVGILFPIFSELVTGQKITVGPPFYEKAAGPLFALLLLIMGVVPLSGWSARSGKSLRRQLWKPAVISLLLPVTLFLCGIRDWFAILGLWVVFLSVCTTLFDYIRSVLVHARQSKISTWRSMIRTTLNNRRRYGGYIVHLGVALMGLGIIGIEFFQTQTQALVRQDESIEIAGYTLTYQGLDIEDTTDGREVATANIHVVKNGREMETLHPAREYFYVSDQAVSRPGVRSTLTDDLYVVLADWLPVTTEGATFKVYHNPLVKWLWIGTYVLVFGTLLALWPANRKRGKLISTEKGAA